MERNITLIRFRMVDLSGKIEGFRQTQRGIVRVEHRRSAPHLYNYRLTDPLDDAALDIGEIVQHLRTALNYLICALAGDQADTGSQFPICDTPERFQRKSPSELKGLSPEQIALVESFQPYRDNNWMAKVRDLSNQDKHRRPIGISAGPSRIGFHALSQRAVETPLGNPMFVPDTVQMEYNFGLPLIFTKDKSPVIETLQLLQFKVAEVIDAFRPFLD